MSRDSESAGIDRTVTTDVFAALRADQVQAIVGEEHFRFRCTACGRCCQGPGSVYFTDADLEAVYAHLKLTTATARRELYKRLIQHKENGYHVHHTDDACILLDEQQRCSVYPVRPMQCSSFPFWPSTFASRDDLEEVMTECPGTMAARDRTNEDAQHSALATARRVNRTRREFLEPQHIEHKRFMI